MAEIEMERRPRSKIWIWVGLVLLVLVLAVGAYLLWARGTTGAETSPTAEPPPVEDPLLPPAGDQYRSEPFGTPPDTLDRPDTSRTVPQP